MRSPRSAAGTDASPGRGYRILASSARLLRAQLELRDGPRVHAACGREPFACRACADREGALRGQCLHLRESRAEAAAQHNRPLEWRCPHGVELSVHPLTGHVAGAGPSMLVRLGPGPRARRGGAPVTPDPSGGTEAFPLRLGDDRGRGGRRAFLRDLARLLAEESILTAELQERSAELTARCDELRMFYSVAGSLAVPRDLRTALRNTIEFVRLAQNADAAALVDPGRRFREVRVRPGLEAEAGPGRRHAWTALQAALPPLLANGSGFFVGSPWDSAGESPFGRTAEVLAVALQGDGGGFLTLLHLDGRHSFRTSDVKLVESLAEQILLATANAELYEDLRRFLMSTVKSLVGAIEAKDSYTSGHSERVNLVSMLIGRRLGLSPEDRETLRWASILHDVGKIGMPEAILRKPDRLTPEEFRIIKEHPDRGYRLLLPIGQLAAAAAIVRAHHETVDGRGYPRGLRGEEIPLLARIIAVADTFDALTSTRPYRTARSFDHALAEIHRVRGTQLDSRVVDGFLDLVPFLREHRVMIQAVSFPEREEAA